MRRDTRQRRLVTRALSEQPGFVTAQGLHESIEATGETIGLATVYRTLAALAADGLADALSSPDGQTRYRACASNDHHHHLVCRGCGLTVEVEGAAVEAWAHDVAAKHGFTQARHVVDVYGICPDCSRPGLVTGDATA